MVVTFACRGSLMKSIGSFPYTVLVELQQIYVRSSLRPLTVWRDHYGERGMVHQSATVMAMSKASMLLTHTPPNRIPEKLSRASYQRGSMYLRTLCCCKPSKHLQWAPLRLAPRWRHQSSPHSPSGRGTWRRGSQAFCLSRHISGDIPSILHPSFSAMSPDHHACDQEEGQGIDIAGYKISVQRCTNRSTLPTSKCSINTYFNATTRTSRITSVKTVKRGSLRFPTHGWTRILPVRPTGISISNG